MRSGCALFVWLFVWSTTAAALQSTLPARENLLVVGARKMRQANTQAPLELTLTSGKHITVTPQDVHAPATTLVRRAMAGQAYRAVEPSLLFVLHIRELAPVSKSDVKVTLSSGAIIRVRSSDVNDVRLTFLRTELARARSAAASVASALRDCAPSSEAAQATEPATSAMSAPGTSERFAPTGAEQPVQAGAPPPGVQIQGDPANAETAKTDFDWGPWLSRFKAQIKRCWFVPYAAMAHHGHVVLTFNVHRDGSITDLRILKPADIDAFTNSAFYAIKKSNPTIPLPPEYPADRMIFTVTLYFNETPPGG